MYLLRSPFVLRERRFRRKTYRNHTERTDSGRYSKDIPYHGTAFLIRCRSPYGTKSKSLRRKKQILRSGSRILLPELILHPRTVRQHDMTVSAHHHGKRSAKKHFCMLESPGERIKHCATTHHHKLPRLPVLGRRCSHGRS